MCVAFDHELKLRRALKHLEDLDAETKSWIDSCGYTVRYELDPEARWIGPVPPGAAGKPPSGSVFYLASPLFLIDGEPRVVPKDIVFGQGVLTAYATLPEQPPTYPISLLIADTLHNLRSALDVLAYALAAAFTKQPLPEEIAKDSEFPIIGDENRKGKLGVGSDLFKSSAPRKIRGWDPRAQALVERAQPYRGKHGFRTHPLWLLHDLDRISKHRLLHTTVGLSTATVWDRTRTTNIRLIGPGLIQVLTGPVEADTPIGRVYGLHPIDPSLDMHMEISPSLVVALSEQASIPAAAPVVELLGTIATLMRDELFPRFAPYL
jgi:hypothetical protein